MMYIVTTQPSLFCYDSLLIYCLYPQFYLLKVKHFFCYGDGLGAGMKITYIPYNNTLEFLSFSFNSIYATAKDRTLFEFEIGCSEVEVVD